jgi:hypothetical protein
MLSQVWRQVNGSVKMDFMTRRSTRYKTMTAQGVYSGQLTCLNTWSGRWRVELSHASHVSRASAKEIATEFLVSEFQATGISFFVDKDNRKMNGFYATFSSDIL